MNTKTKSKKNLNSNFECRSHQYLIGNMRNMIARSENLLVRDFFFEKVVGGFRTKKLRNRHLQDANLRHRRELISSQTPEPRG